MLLTHRPPASWLVSDKQSIPHSLVWLGLNLSTQYTNLYVENSVHIFVLVSKSDCTIQRIASELPHLWELSLPGDWCVCSVVEITGILIYLSVLISKWQKKNFEEATHRPLLAKSFTAVRYFKKIYPSAKLL